MFGQLRKKHRKLNGISKRVSNIFIQKNDIKVIKHVLNTTSVVKKIKSHNEKTFSFHTNNYYTFSSIGQSLLRNLDYNFNSYNGSMLLPEHIIQMFINKDYKKIFDFFYKCNLYRNDFSIKNLKKPKYNHDNSVVYFVFTPDFLSYNPIDFLNSRKKLNPIHNFSVLSILYCLSSDIDKNTMQEIFNYNSVIYVFYSVGHNKIYYIVKTPNDELSLNMTSPSLSIIEMTRSSDKVDVMIQKLNKSYQITLPEGSVEKCFEYISRFNLGKEKKRIGPKIRKRKNQISE